jgi:hypothetical protein
MYKKAGVKFSFKLFIELTLSILLTEDSIYHDQSRDPKDDKLLTQKSTHCWMQQFMDVHNIVLLSQRGNLSCSPEKERQIEMNTAYHLDVLQRGFQFGVFDENLIENLDKIHFTVNMNNDRTLGFRGDMVIKYADVVAGGDAMTMVIRISRGRRSMVEAPMLISTNGNSNYPIRGLEDTIPKVCYRTGPKGWMDQALFSQYFEEPRAYQIDIYNRTKTILVDNCTGYNITPRLSMVLAKKRTTLRYLPLCATHLCQLMDTFIISKIKDTWTKRWEAKKLELIQQDSWQNKPRDDGQWSGKLTNLGKKFFLQLATDSIEDVNRQVDIDNMSYARESMIKCGLALGADSTWNINQLFSQLQQIVVKHQQYFEGLEVPQLHMTN